MIKHSVYIYSLYSIVHYSTLPLSTLSAWIHLKILNAYVCYYVIFSFLYIFTDTGSHKYFYSILDQTNKYLMECLHIYIDY